MIQNTNNISFQGIIPRDLMKKAEQMSKQSELYFDLNGMPKLKAVKHKAGKDIIQVKEKGDGFVFCIENQVSGKKMEIKTKPVWFKVWQKVTGAPKEYSENTNPMIVKVAEATAKLIAALSKVNI